MVCGAISGVAGVAAKRAQFCECTGAQQELPSKPIVEGLRKQLISYAWVAENGYAHHRLKHRQLAQLFITGVPS
jgi:hypothetical protein